MRPGWLVPLLLAACAPSAEARYDLHYAVGRAMRQTDPRDLKLFEDELDVPYVVLADIHVAMRQETAFGAEPTRADVENELRVRAARLGAHAIVLVRFGEPGPGFFTGYELQGSGRAIRFR
ncbi:MAG: hypothetical protein HYV09_40925 [Deltaproteobacteria bacterium]|nr:hypothetical protein [Deltaproteobacteria bacterium]